MSIVDISGYPSSNGLFQFSLGIADFKMIVITNKDIASWGTKFNLIVFCFCPRSVALLEELEFAPASPMRSPGVSSILARDGLQYVP